ncbi:hypothetical protein AAHA92_31285 [Salvia divinorum]|uniref:Uncharacterized protein n=1 Tax=Salvia divinorum TaxID=28513 RepID=A0ABD1FTP1_SALDI
MYAIHKRSNYMYTMRRLAASGSFCPTPLSPCSVAIVRNSADIVSSVTVGCRAASSRTVLNFSGIKILSILLSRSELVGFWLLPSFGEVVDWWGRDSADGLSRDGLCTAVPGRSLGCPGRDELVGRALGCSAEVVGSQLAISFTSRIR